MYIECKRIEQNERRFQRERDDLLRTLAGMESGLASLSLRVDDPTNSLPPLNIGSRPRVPRRSDGMELDSPVANNNMIAMPSPYSGPSSLPAAGSRQKSGSVSGGATPKQPQAISLSSAPTVPETSFDPVHCLTQPTAPLTTSSLTTKTHKPVHFRSSLIPQPKSSLKQKVNAVIQEMGAHPERLVMPTAANLEKLEGLQAAAGGLLDMKKALDRVEQEIRINKARLRGGSEAAETDADGAGETDRGRTDREGSVISAEPSGSRVCTFFFRSDMCSLVNAAVEPLHSTSARHRWCRQQPPRPQMFVPGNANALETPGFLYFFVPVLLSILPFNLGSFHTITMSTLAYGEG